MKKSDLIFFIFSLITFSGWSQYEKTPFNIRLEKMQINNFPSLQAFSFGTLGDKWVLMGGRTDGLHRRQPFAAFNEAGMNKFIYVVDIKKERVLKKDLIELTSTLAEQLSSTNMQFYQENKWLVITGGYGFSPSTKKFFTHPYIIIVDIPKLINAIEKNKSIKEAFIQIKDERFAVTGGRLNKLHDVFYLAGGQRFNGRYNPHGPDHGPGFSQQYTNAIRRFTIAFNSSNPTINHLPQWYDSLLLHRRDYNLLPQLNEKNEKFLTIFSGVFQYKDDIPFTTLVDVNPNGYQLYPGFEQQFNHYHSATLPIYDETHQTMYSVFFGGIAYKYLSAKGDTVTDKNVPFVNTISVIERSAVKSIEYVLPVSMPGYLGAAAEFIPDNNKQYYKNGILKINKSRKKPFVAGYIAGGINSSSKNIFFDNNGDESSASTVIWKVIID